MNAAQKQSRRRYGAVHYDIWDSDRFRTLSPVQRLVYVALTMYAQHGEGEVYPTQSQLCGTIGLCKRTVAQAIRRLKELGYIEVERETMGTRRRNHYKLLTPPPGRP